MERRYRLVLEIDSASLEVLRRAHVRVALAKGSATTRPSVAWLAWTPSENDTVTWNENYGIYAALGPVEAGTAIRLQAAVYPAAHQMNYVFLEDRFGTPAPQPTIPPGHIEIRNGSSSPQTMGLLQAANRNGEVTRAPLDAIVVPRGLSADFTVANTAYVWLGRDVTSGTIATVPADATALTFSRDARTKRCVYDCKAEHFRET